MERRTPCAPGARGRTAPVQGDNYTHGIEVQHPDKKLWCLSGFSKGWMLNGVSRPYATNFVRKVQFKHQSMYHQELKITGHDKESNCISDAAHVHKNWCILSKHDKMKKCSIFSEVLKLEPIKFTIPYGRSFKSENFMFFGLPPLNIIQNLIFKLWMAFVYNFFHCLDLIFLINDS